MVLSTSRNTFYLNLNTIFWRFDKLISKAFRLHLKDQSRNEKNPTNTQSRIDTLSLLIIAFLVMGLKS